MKKQTYEYKIKISGSAIVGDLIESLRTLANHIEFNACHSHDDIDMNYEDENIICELTANNDI